MITADEQARGGKALPLKSIVDEALGMGGCEGIRNVIVYRRTGGNVAFEAPRDLWLHELVAKQAGRVRARMGRRRASALHPLHVRLDRQAQRCTAQLRAATCCGRSSRCGGRSTSSRRRLLVHRRHRLGDGHTYIAYGPLACGATEVVFEGVPTYPDAGRFWQTIAKHKVRSSTRRQRRSGRSSRRRASRRRRRRRNYDLSRCGCSGTVGEPINPEAWMWYHEKVGDGRCPIVDTWWQTETGGHLITPLPGVTPTVPGSCTLPLPGIMAAIVDETGHDVENGHGGILVIKHQWQAMIRTIWGDPDRYRKSYYPDELRRQALPCRRRLGARRDDDVLHDHGSHRRRPQRLRAPPRYDGDRIGSGREPDGGGGGGGRPSR